MSEKIMLNARPRSLRGKKVKTLRQVGRMPVIIYGNVDEPISLDVEIKEFIGVAHAAGATQVITVDVEGESTHRSILIREVQQHVTRLTPIHADLFQVDLTQKLRASVPVFVVVQPALVIGGEATLTQVLNEVTVEALPDDFPSSIEIDASVLRTFDDSVVAGDIDLGGKAEIIGDPEQVILTLQHARAAEVIEDDVEAMDEGDVPVVGEEGEGEDSADDEG
jgi:large subunit ribosomal protein L25